VPSHLSKSAPAKQRSGAIGSIESSVFDIVRKKRGICESARLSGSETFAIDHFRFTERGNVSAQILF